MKPDPDKLLRYIALFFKSAGVVVCIIYFMICLYAGLTGEIEYLQGTVRLYSMRGHPSVSGWTAGGLGASIGCAVCLDLVLNDLNLWVEGRKKRSWLFDVIAYVPGLSLFLLEAYQKMHMAGIWMDVVIMLILYTMATLPGAIRRRNSRAAFAGQQPDADSPAREPCTDSARQQPNSDSPARELNSDSPGRRADAYPTCRRGRQLRRKIEWIRCYPLKKMLLFLLWVFCAYISVRSVQLMLAVRQTPGDIVFSVFFWILTASTVYPVIKYIRNACHSVPYLNRILTGKEMESLLEKEYFEQAVFSHDFLKKYCSVFQSDHWLVVQGTVISRKLAFMVSLKNTDSTRACLEVIYLNGKKVRAKLGHDLSKECRKELRAFLGDLPDAPYWDDWEKKLCGRLAERFGALLPEMETEAEKIRFLLRHDTEEIKAEYMAVENVTKP